MRADLREKINIALAVGEDEFDDVVEEGVYHFEDEADVDTDELTEAAREVAIEAFAAYVAEQATWPAELDADRLFAAFGDLDTAGIVARANFACCQGCGLTEIGGEVPDGTTARGYVFCHEQDVERAVDGGGLYLSYGAFDDRAKSAAIGEEIAATLRRHGLTTEWEGDVSKRIQVPMTWRRRRYGPLATWPGGPVQD